jgi:predicted ABC-type sugar transport system permease subunit
MYTERRQGAAWSDLLAENAQVLSILAFFLACLVFFSLGSANFPTLANFLNILRQAAPILVVAVAMTFVIVTAGIDLSVGSTDTDAAAAAVEQDEPQRRGPGQEDWRRRHSSSSSSASAWPLAAS